jgi:hypothetical protein
MLLSAIIRNSPSCSKYVSTGEPAQTSATICCSRFFGVADGGFGLLPRERRDHHAALRKCSLRRDLPARAVKLNA